MECDSIEPQQNGDSQMSRQQTVNATRADQSQCSDAAGRLVSPDQAFEHFEELAAFSSCVREVQALRVGPDADGGSRERFDR
jgi:hypothetical protein